MARKTLRYTIETEGRDKGKVFLITEMPARQAEAWAMRAFLALARGGTADVPPDVEEMGFAGIASLGLSVVSNMRWEDAQPLFDEMLQCVQIATDPKHPTVTRDVIDDDFEEVATLVELRREVFKLHVDFSMVASRLKQMREATGAAPDSPDTGTSPA